MQAGAKTASKTESRATTTRPSKKRFALQYPDEVYRKIIEQTIDPKMRNIILIIVNISHNIRTSIDVPPL